MKGFFKYFRLLFFIMKVKSYGGVKVNFWMGSNRIFSASYLDKPMNIFLHDYELVMLRYCIMKKEFIQVGEVSIPANRNYTDFLKYPLYNSK